jgi:phage terminase large subunit-like protein
VAHENRAASNFDPSKLSLEQLQEELRNLTQQGDGLLRSTAFLRFKPYAFQRPWYESQAQVRAIFGGNRVGKSTCGAIEVLSAALGTRPLALGGTDRAKFARNLLRGHRIFVGGESFDLLRETVLAKLEEFVTPAMLLGRPRTNEQGFPYHWRFITGAELMIHSYQQDKSTFEGPAWHWAWFDEPPPQAIFNAVRRGMMETRGRVLVTATPLKEPWMVDELVEPAHDPDCRECEGGEIPHDEIVLTNPMHGRVEHFTAEMHDTCRTCHGEGALEHDEIEAFLASITDPREREARSKGVPAHMGGLEFGYVRAETHVVPDVDPVALNWPIVEIVDPAMKRPLHYGWFTVDPDDRWYWFWADLVPNNGFKTIVASVHGVRRAIGAQPDRKIMDQRGGQHRIDAEQAQDWFDKFHAAGITYEKSSDTSMQAIHDWLRPVWVPRTLTSAPLIPGPEERNGGFEIPKLRICRRVADMPKGPMWAFERFIWNYEPTKRDRQQWEQRGKDWIDLVRYLRAADFKFEKLMARKEGGSESASPLAMSYNRNEAAGGPRARRQRSSLAESYNRPSDWTGLIRRGYS